MIRFLLVSGLAGGIVGGLIVAGFQIVMTTPLIIAAEAFEVAAPHAHGDGAMTEQASEATRYVLTGIATIVVATGYAWMLLAAMTAKGATIDARSAAIWAVAGFLATGIAPAMGLPPGLPGSASADLLWRQTWWFGTAAATIGGIALFVWSRTTVRAIAGLVIILLPHVIGAPHADGGDIRLPAELAATFAARSLGIQALIWFIPAAIAGWTFARLKRRG